MESIILIVLPWIYTDGLNGFIMLVARSWVYIGGIANQYKRPELFSYPRQPYNIGECQMPKRFSNGSRRLKKYDYSQRGNYFVTICTKDHIDLFGQVIDSQVDLTTYGQIAKDYWREIPNHFSHAKLDEFVVMPDHIHGIISITKSIGSGNLREFGNRKAGTLSTIIGAYKSAVTNKIKQLRTHYKHSIWQNNYHDRVIRGEKEFFRIRNYIKNNPVNWSTNKKGHSQFIGKEE
jgi:REP element-mobilizing transposase RayT